MVSSQNVRCKSVSLGKQQKESKVLLKSYSVTDIGRKRQLNQDYVYSSGQPVGKLPNLFIVADGMGGHKAGDFASKYTVETIEQEIKQSFEKNPTTIIKHAISVANEHVRRKAASDPNLTGMGTTVVVATIIGKYLQVANVGDSRLYIINDTEIKQVTRDHSLVEEMIRLGGIERKDARLHPDKNIITRAIGARDEVEADFFTVELGATDTVLMCSDGLTNMLEDQEIMDIIHTHDDPRNLVETAQALIDAANNNGGKDNIAVVLVKPFVDEVIV